VTREKHHRQHIEAWEEDPSYAEMKKDEAGPGYASACHARLYRYKWSGIGSRPKFVFILEAPTQSLESAMAPLAEKLTSTTNCAVYIAGRHIAEGDLAPSVFALATAQMDHIDAIRYLADRYPGALICSYGNSGGGLRVATAHRYLLGAHPDLADRHCCVASGVPSESSVPWQLRLLALARPVLSTPLFIQPLLLRMLSVTSAIFAPVVVFASYPFARWLYWWSYWAGAQLDGSLRPERLIAEVHHVVEDARMAEVAFGSDLRPEVLSSERVLIIVDPEDGLVEVSGWIGHRQVVEILGKGHNPQEEVAEAIAGWAQQWRGELSA